MKRALVLVLLIAGGIAAAQGLLRAALADTGGRQWVSSGYGPRENPMGGAAGASIHFGEDLATRRGTPILALEDGQVIVCAYGDPVFGRYMVVRDALGYDTTYAHLSEAWYPKGAFVSRGMVIGLSGNTGASTGPHEHVQVTVDPELYALLVAGRHAPLVPVHPHELWR